MRIELHIKIELATLQAKYEELWSVLADEPDRPKKWLSEILILRIKIETLEWILEQRDAL